MSDKWTDFYKPTKNREYYDLSGGQTTFVESQYDVTTDSGREAYEAIETQFIDELYGTTNAEWSTENQSEGEFWQQDEFDSTWGLDLRRTMLDEDGETITASHPDYYEHLTRGEVDWSSYENDPKYISAFKEIGETIYDLTDDDYTDAKKVSWIREASAHMEKTDEENGDKAPTNWEGKYDKDKIYRDDAGNLFIDGKQQQTLLDLYNSPDGRLSVNSPKEQDDIKERRVIGRPNIPGVTWTPTGKGWDKPSLKNPAKLRLPGNIPKSWVNKTPTNPPAPKGGTK